MASAKLSIFHLARNGAERKTAAAAAFAEVINLIHSHNRTVGQRVNSPVVESRALPRGMGKRCGAEDLRGDTGH